MIAIKEGWSRDTNITGITQPYLAVHLSTHLHVYLSISPPVSFSLYLPICMSISPLCPLDILQAVTIRLQGWRVNYSLVANVFGPIDFVSGSPWIRYPGSGLMALSLLNN